MQPTMFTEREYLAVEAVAATKHEYTRGHIVAMAGAEYAHNRIAMNTAVELTRVIGDGPSVVVGSDQRVKVEATQEYFYPDVTVVCAEPKLVGPSPRSLTNPSIIVEILSPSTSAYDSGEKLDAYRRIPTITDYLLVGSDRRHALHYHRSGDDAWGLRTHTTGETVVLQNGIALEVDRLYRMVDGV